MLLWCCLAFFMLTTTNVFYCASALLWICKKLWSNNFWSSLHRNKGSSFRNGLIPLWIKMMCNAQRTRLLLAALEARRKKKELWRKTGSHPIITLDFLLISYKSKVIYPKYYRFICADRKMGIGPHPWYLEFVNIGNILSLHNLKWCTDYVHQLLG